MATITRYPTRPLAIWPKMKDLRRKLNREAWEVRANGGVVVVTQNLVHSLLAGIGPWGRRLYGPYYAKAMRDQSLLIQQHGVADARGFPRGEMCSAMHRHVGEMLQGLTTSNPQDGSHSPVDLIFEADFCASVAKTAQLAGELLGVPAFVLDMPYLHNDGSVQYVAAQMHKAIDFLTHTTGKEYHDDLLIEAVQNWWEQGALLARVGAANKAIPATLDFQLMTSLMVPSVVGAHRADVVEFYEELLAEIEERVRDGISAHGVETARLSYEGEWMNYAEDFIPTVVRRYGAVVVAGRCSLSLGLWDVTPDGQWAPVPRWRDLGITLKGRDDAIEFLARGQLNSNPVYRMMRLDERQREIVRRVEDYSCVGTILHLDIGCRGLASVVMGAKRALKEAGYPAVTYQASNSDPRDFSAEQVTDALESFLERLGLDPIDDSILKELAEVKHG